METKDKINYVKNQINERLDAEGDILSYRLEPVINTKEGGVAISIDEQLQILRQLQKQRHIIIFSYFEGDNYLVLKCRHELELEDE